MNKMAIIHAAMFTPISRGRWGLPLLFRGPPGVAKTQSLDQASKKAGLIDEILSPGERGEGAFGVVPVPVQVDGRTVLSYPMPEWAAKMNAVGRGLVVIDEISSAPPAIQPPLLGLIQERMIGGNYLAPGVRVMATANPTEQAAGGWDLAMPVANRLGHVDWEAPSATDWSEWLLGAIDSHGGGESDEKPLDPAAEEARVLAAWQLAFAKARGAVSGFLRKRPDLLLKVPEVNSPQASKAWPSPRSWENATRALASSMVHGLSPADRDTFVAAFVGEGAANEMVVWMEKADIPDPVDVLDGKVKFKHDPKRLDISDAVLAACTALITSEKTVAVQKARASKMWTLLETMVDDAADIVQPAAVVLSRARLLGAASMKTLAKINPILDAIAAASKA